MSSLWGKIPSWIRGPVTGILILLVALQPIIFLIQLNQIHFQQVPWSILPSAIFLWLCWSYLGGSGPPSSTRALRQNLLRANRVSAEKGALVWVSAIFIVMLISAFTVLSFSIQTLSMDRIGLVANLFELPTFTALGIIALVAIMSGVIEEAAFRGYMQRIMGKRHHPVLAILVTALMFALVHPQPLLFILIFMGGASAWGILAYLSDSIYPTIAAHALIDFLFIMWAWLNPDSLQALLDFNILETGVNQFFLFWTAVWVIALAGFIWSSLKLWQLNKSLVQDSGNKALALQ